MAPKMNSRHGTNHYVDLFDGLHQAPVIGKRALEQAGSLPLELQQHLQLVDVQPNLRPPENVRGVALRQAGLDEPPPNVAGPTHHQNLAFRHLFCGPSLTFETNFSLRELVFDDMLRAMKLVLFSTVGFQHLKLDL
ncbi:LRR and NB-ARC domains-containing diseaseresistance protein [Striga asiatica]|uniref:LRR and NB-ARC domains-containing diseaseresistance protein n=1 Tax=Striga asiatica TaxID=4170 RepID=A0A5A7RK38_STRAF|nr:LRR and NB-ARC domains-containing diseaseresistance protein [Striga asiatica]